MKHSTSFILSLTIAFLASGCGGSSSGGGGSGERALCDDYDPLRQPLFGELHLHTKFSFDAFIVDTRDTQNDPWDAYQFARGEQLFLPDIDGNQTRPIQLRRPLDFAAVTDHAEQFAEMQLCLTDGDDGFDMFGNGTNSFLCRAIRNDIPIPGAAVFLLFGTPGSVAEPPFQLPMCGLAGVDCNLSALSLWKEIQAAAAANNDRCEFTTFVAYEASFTPGGANLHRNVIFRNDKVVDLPVSYIETNGPNPSVLWARLQAECIDGMDGCDVLTITHNANLSGPAGQMYLDPDNAEDPYDAATRQRFEPLTEIVQHKGQSECRFERLNGMGLDTTDELCTFEQRLGNLLVVFGGADPTNFNRRNFIRNVLKDGLALEQRDGVNPFKQGLIGSTDSHNGTPGYTLEDDFKGHLGRDDADPAGLISDDLIRDGPGGLAVVWAEENSRDSIFDALERREVYGTSGTRPIVRFFGGWEFPLDLCTQPGAIEEADDMGVPMGSDLSDSVGSRNPRFLVSALKDPGTCDPAVDDPADADYCDADDIVGTPLQRIQIIKGWVDSDGETHERVVDVAGDPNNGAGVDRNCHPRGDGFAELCTVWTDEAFDSEQHAFYYARVLENPTCRWSTRVCQQVDVDPFAQPAECKAMAREANRRVGQQGAFDDCCLTEENDGFFEPVLQERAWTSPIWYRPQ